MGGCGWGDGGGGGVGWCVCVCVCACVYVCVCKAIYNHIKLYTNNVNVMYNNMSCYMSCPSHVKEGYFMGVEVGWGWGGGGVEVVLRWGGDGVEVGWRWVGWRLVGGGVEVG